MDVKYVHQNCLKIYDFSLSVCEKNRYIGQLKTWFLTVWLSIDDDRSISSKIRPKAIILKTTDIIYQIKFKQYFYNSVDSDYLAYNNEYK